MKFTVKFLNSTLPLVVCLIGFSAWATKSCHDHLVKHLPGAQFLHQRNPKLHHAKVINQYLTWKNHSTLAPSSRPTEKLAAWMNHLENTHFRYATNSRYKEKLKEFYFRDQIIKEQDVPDSYFSLQMRIARERGQGPLEISAAERKKMVARLISEQRQSLEVWLDYLLSKDSEIYPMWAKYWIFTGLVKLGAFDKEKAQFAKRTPSTVAPFPDLNREALAYVVDAIIKKTNQESLDHLRDAVFIDGLRSSPFGSLYARALERSKGSTTTHSTINGQWVKYLAGSDHGALYEALQGKHTGWCTAGEATAKSQLMLGDFYVYYSQDQKGEATDPRIAIRMEDEQIAEVRGVGPNQNLDNEIAKSGILSKKLEEFGEEGRRFQKADEQMRTLTAIESKYQSGAPLDLKDLRFIYEIDEPILSLGYGKDPRIDELISGRNIKEDLALILGLSTEQISTQSEEAINGSITFHYGDLYVDEAQVKQGLTLPLMVGGNLDLRNLHSAKGLILPRRVGGSLDLGGLNSANGLTLPRTIGGYLDLSSLQSAKDLSLPRTVGDFLDLRSLQAAEGLILPKKVGGYLDLGALKSGKGLLLPQIVGDFVDLGVLKSAQGLTLPVRVGDFLDLGGLKSTKGLILPQEVGGDLYLTGIKSAETLILPPTLGGRYHGPPIKSKSL